MKTQFSFLLIAILVLGSLSSLSAHDKLRIAIAEIGGKPGYKAWIPVPILLAGEHIEGKAGAKVDFRYAPPVKSSGTITSLYDNPGNREAVVKVGNVYVIVTEKRKGFHRIVDFSRHQLNPADMDIVVVKLGYLVEELYEAQADWMMAHTLGGVNQDLVNLPYKRINRPMFPLDKNMTMPDLSARLIP